MDDPYRDQAELHRASPLLAVVVAAMTLATAPLSQSTSPADGPAEPSPVATRGEQRVPVVVAAEVDAPPPVITGDSKTDTLSQS